VVAAPQPSTDHATVQRALKALTATLGQIAIRLETRQQQELREDSVERDEDRDVA
jgi:hypothetical protein